ncbi:hypothetical protein ACLOJK_041798 [Asimina triloba]
MAWWKLRNYTSGSSSTGMCSSTKNACCAETHNQAAIAVNKRLSQEIDRLNSQLADTRLIYVDIYTVLNDIIRRPAAYGN